MNTHFPKCAALAAVILMTATLNARADDVTENGFGLGFVIGDPSGISASLPVGANTAFNVLAGYQISHQGANLTLLGDYVWHQRDLITVDVGKVSLYYGPGVQLTLAKNSEAGIRAVVGIDYLFEGKPLQAFLEVCPGINVVPNTNPTATAGLGLRYFF